MRLYVVPTPTLPMGEGAQAEDIAHHAGRAAWVAVPPVVVPPSAITGSRMEAFRSRSLPRHPLTRDGYRSIGCATCTARTPEGADARAGRWLGQSKEECGIHFAPIQLAG